MTQHIQLTMILFFVNMMITFTTPQYTFIDNNIYTQDEYGEFTYNDNFTDTVAGGLTDNANIAVSALGIVDVFFMILDFFKYILSFFIALPVLIFLLPLASTVKVVFFFPVLLLYSFALIGWIRGK